MLCTGTRRSEAETEPSVTRPSVEPSCSARGCQSPSHSAASLSANCVCLTISSVGKSGPQDRDARHISLTVFPLPDKCQQQKFQIED